MNRQPIWTAVAAAFVLLSYSPNAAAGAPAEVPECEDVLSDEWCDGLAPPTCEEFLGPTRCAGPGRTCDSIFNDAICDVFFSS